jgi:hypothetical protein
MTEFSGDSTGPGSFSLETLDTAQSDRTRSSFVIDLRRSPRVETRLPASLISEHGRVAGLITNLSRTGLRFEFDRALADFLLQDSGRVSECATVIVEASFEVPGADPAPMSVIVQARLVYVIHSSSDICQCGLEFRAFAEGEELLENYLRERGAAG